MVPGMACLIMRWGREFAVWTSHLPICLTFQIDAMTGSTVGSVDLLTQGNELEIFWE